MINGLAGISPEMAIRLAKAFGGSADIWVNMQAAYDLAQAMEQAEKIDVAPLHSPRHAARSRSIQFTESG